MVAEEGARIGTRGMGHEQGQKQEQIWGKVHNQDQEREQTAWKRNLKSTRQDRGSTSSGD